VARRGSIGLRLEGPIDGQLPSATAMFQSAAGIYGSRTAAVVLTGIGEDGVAGARAVHEAKGRVIAQSEASCVVFGTPKLVIDRGFADLVVHGDSIGAMLWLSAFEREARPG
jgi:two-component system chemotaxis response regulator CheB